MTPAGFPDPVAIKIDRTSAIPVLDIKVGHAQLGTYEAVIWPLRGKPRRIGRGSTLDPVPDQHRIVRTRKQLQQIDRFIITVVITVTAVSRAAGARWSWDLKLSQADVELAKDSDQGTVTSPLFAVRRAFEIDLV